MDYLEYIFYGLIILCFLLLVLKILSRHSKKILASTNEWCSAKEEINKFLLDNLPQEKNKELEELLKKENKAYQFFLKYHPFCKKP